MSRAGRGSPHGGAGLSFQHCSEGGAALGVRPVIDRLAANGIDLTRRPIEVAPIAHYHMGGIRTDTDMQTSVPHLFAAGEAVGGANGANRLSGNALTEAFTFGRARACAPLRLPRRQQCLRKFGRGKVRVAPCRSSINAAAEIARLQQVMNEHVGPLRTRAGLERALEHTTDLAEACAGASGAARGLDPEWLDLHDLRNMRLVAESIARRARPRREPRRASAPGLSRDQRALAEASEDPSRWPTECGLKARLRIRRGTPGVCGRYELHEVPFEPGQTVLDALRWIRIHRDPSLAIRFSCINANACKECMINVDGKTVYACITRLTENETTLEPLAEQDADPGPRHGDRASRRASQGHWLIGRTCRRVESRRKAARGSVARHGERF
jgi:hypothetical protein